MGFHRTGVGVLDDAPDDVLAIGTRQRQRRVLTVQDREERVDRGQVSLVERALICFVCLVMSVGAAVALIRAASVSRRICKAVAARARGAGVPDAGTGDSATGASGQVLAKAATSSGMVCASRPPMPAARYARMLSSSVSTPRCQASATCAFGSPSFAKAVARFQ